MKKLNEKIEIINNIKHTLIEKFDTGKLISSEWFVDGKSHRENGLPAKIFSNGTKKWFFHDFLHRENGLPAIENQNQNKFFILGSEIFPHDLTLMKEKIKTSHKNNQIIKEYKDNRENYYRTVNGFLTSYQDNFAMEIRGYEKRWYLNGKEHRENDLPAIINSCEKHWLINGKYHRNLEKPAFISTEEGIEYWFEGKYYSEEEVKNYFLKKKIDKF